MSKSLQTLVVAACIASLIFVGYYFWGELQQGIAIRHTKNMAEQAAHEAGCQAALDRLAEWDSGASSSSTPNVEIFELRACYGDCEAARMRVAAAGRNVGKIERNLLKQINDEYRQACKTNPGAT